MNDASFRISFDNATDKEANKHAEELEKALTRTHPNVQLERERERPDTLDLGTVLALVLGTEAIVAVAKGIHAYLTKYHDVSITITDKDRKVEAKNLTAQTAVTVIEEVLRNGQEPNQKKPAQKKPAQKKPHQK